MNTTECKGRAAHTLQAAMQVVFVQNNQGNGRWSYEQCEVCSLYHVRKDTDDDEIRAH